MEKLENQLKNFNPSSEEELSSLFKNLAKSFLYGGYVAVRDGKGNERYRIYLRTVEFYCHYEGDKLDLPKDPIVYHRNGRYIEGDIPYFPLMAFHAHASGIDITFENAELHLRSSALIRAYEIYDVQRKKFLVYDRGEKVFVDCPENKKRVNPQSTYLYSFLNGFIGESVKWVDKSWSDTKTCIPGIRKNVFLYNGEKKTSAKDNREWSFTRTEEIPDNLLPN